MKLIVTDLGPIDRHKPGEDVTGLYDDETAARLIDEGYLVDADAKTKRSRKREAAGVDDGD